MNFLVLSGKMMFLFPENIILFFRRKMKDDLSQKNSWKNYIFFKYSEKMVFPKKSHWNVMFLVLLSGKLIFLFPENIIVFFRRKMKDNLCQNNKWKYDIFSNAPKRWSFKKKLRWNMVFFVLSEKMVLFSEKYDIVSLDKK